MTEWYYARGGKQSGPVSFEQLAEIARTGGLDPLKDLVWTPAMKDWCPAGQVPDLFRPPPTPLAPPADPANPYAAPDSSWTEIARITAGEALQEIIPGSEPIDVGGCVKRGFELTCRHFGMILLIGIVYIAVTTGAGILLGIMDSVLGLKDAFPAEYHADHEAVKLNFHLGYTSNQTGSYLNFLMKQILSIFLSLGATRVGLNIVSGKEFSLDMLFGGAGKLLPAIGATILYGLMVAIGLLLLIVPGIYLAMRYGQYMTAMVDRNLGILQSFEYSSSITTNNRMNLFLLLLLSFLIAVAGCLALCIGLVFAFPVISLSWVVAYRWMQYGHRAALDHHGTKTPMLTGL